MSKYKAILEEHFRKALNFSDGELAELFKKSDEELTDEDVASIAEKGNTKYIQTISSINKTADLKLEEKFKAGQRTKAKEFEDMLKNNFGINSDKTGAELIDELKESLSKSSTKSGKDLTDDDVKKHPAYIRAENEYKAQLKAANEDKERSINELQQSYQRKEVFNSVGEKAWNYLIEKGAIPFEDTLKAEAQKKRFLRDLEAYDYETVDGKPVALYREGEKAGKRVENEFGHALEFEQLIDKVGFLHYDFRVATDREAPHGAQGSNAASSATNGTTYKGAMPKSLAEYEGIINNPNISIPDKKAVNEYWSQQATV